MYSQPAIEVGYEGHGIGALRAPEYHYITADCGHEVYVGEEICENDNGKTLCPDCLKREIIRAAEHWSTAELADMWGYSHTAVGR